MSPRRTDEASRLTSALTGASVALGIAREATDAVPIVKQVLGAALRIVGLAEKMENDREALRALGASSLQLARQVTAVMAAKTPNDGLQASFERILKALNDIESFMNQHAARGRLRRFVSYAFTVPQHVKRLSGELADAVRDLTVVALLDVDKQVHATRSAVEDNAGFDGEFRLLRHCEVQKLERVFDCEDREDKKEVVRYHRAHVDGQLLVVRYFEGNTPQHWPSRQEPNETMFDRIAFQDRILEEISTVQKSHPNVARIYGWGRGSGRERFTVFKSGYQPVNKALRNSPNPLIDGIHWTAKLLDAVHHLQLMGIHWRPADPPYALDDQLQPIIGLQNDLDRTDKNLHYMSLADYQLAHMTWPLNDCAKAQSVPAAKFQKLLAGCLDERLADRLGRMEPIRSERCIVPKAECSHRRILTDAAAEGLLRIMESVGVEYMWHNDSWMWANILLSLDKNRSHPLMCSLRVVYAAYRRGGDQVHLYGIDEDLEHIVYDIYTFDVPNEQKDGVREMFGISTPSEEEFFTSRVIATGTYCGLLD